MTITVFGDDLVFIPDEMMPVGDQREAAVGQTVRVNGNAYRIVKWRWLPNGYNAEPSRSVGA